MEGAGVELPNDSYIQLESTKRYRTGVFLCFHASVPLHGFHLHGRASMHDASMFVCWMYLPAYTVQ